VFIVQTPACQVGTLGFHLPHEETSAGTIRFFLT